MQALSGRDVYKEFALVQLLQNILILRHFLYLLLISDLINKTKMPSIRIASNDNEIFTVDLKIAKKSVTLKTLLEDLGIGEDAKDDEAVPLPNVNATTLKKVIEWATYHKNDPTYPEDDENKVQRMDISSWDADFLKVDQGTLFELILAANYLDIKVCYLLAH